MVVAGILFLGSQVIETIWVRGNKERVYTTLISIPKNHLTAMVENLHLHKNEHEDGPSTTNTESNRQEDNIVKAFLAGGGSVLSRILDQMVMIISMCLNLGLYMTCQILMQNLIIGHGVSVCNAAPHMVYLHGAWGGMIAALTNFLQLFFCSADNEWANQLWKGNKPGLIVEARADVSNALDSYHKVRRGDQTKSLPPYAGYLDGSLRATEEVSNLCTDTSETFPTSFVQAIQCWSPDMIYEGIEAFVAKVGQAAKDSPLPEAVYDPLIQDLWTIMMWPLYCVLIEPMYAEIIDVIKGDLDKTDGNMYPVIIILVLIAIICQATSVMNIRGIEAHMRNVLHLLQHCPASVLMQTPRVMAVLNGDFSNRRRDETSRNAAFFESIVEQMPEAVLICSTATLSIKSSNAACERILGERFVGQSIGDLLKTRFEGDVQRLLDPSADQRSKVDNLLYRKDKTDTVNLEASVMLMADVTVYVLRDMTQTVRYNTLIAAERSKSDQILQSILPPSLVPRVQAGEKNISFAVASVSIVFIDIVSFTPWCGSSQADKVMMTLNNLFKRFDANCNSYSTMTRIKCIGDCYMGRAESLQRSTSRRSTRSRSSCLAWTAFSQSRI
jgi:PAS domain-containing protein